MKKEYLIIFSLATLFFSINNLKAKNIQKDKKQNIEIIRNGEISSKKGANDYFSGNVMVNGLFPDNHSSNVSLANVTFEAGAKTAWHTHPWGQILLITNGNGQVQQWGKEIIEVKNGDVVWLPANVKHWHGATKNNAMSHILIVANANKGTADWLEKVNVK